jgi:hypothetical protein
LPDFALLVQIFDLHLRFYLKVLHKQFAVVSTDTLYFLSELVCKKIDSFFALLQFYRFFCKHERESHTPVWVQFVTAANKLLDWALVAPFRTVLFIFKKVFLAI